MRAPSVPAALTALACLVGVTAAAAVAPKQVVIASSNAKVERNATPSVLTPSKDIDAGTRPAIKAGTELRILCAGDSITLGTLSQTDGGDGDGYRRQLQADLSSESAQPPPVYETSLRYRAWLTWAPCLRGQRRLRR